MNWGCEEVPFRMLVSVDDMVASREGYRCKKKTPDERAITTNTSNIKPFPYLLKKTRNRVICVGKSDIILPLNGITIDQPKNLFDRG